MMKSWLSQNLEALSKRDAVLAQRIADAEVDTVELLPLETGGFDLSYENSPPVYHHDPEATVKKFWEEQNLDNPLLLTFYGMDLGHHIKHYLKQPKRKEHGILVIEKSVAAFRQALTANDWREELTSGDIEWLIGCETNDLKSWFYQYFREARHLTYLNQIENVCWSPSLERDAQYYLEVARSLVAGSESFASTVISDPEDHFRGLLNLVDNIPLFDDFKPIDLLEGVFKGRPGIVVSTGPSLNKCLPYLKQVQDKAVLFAVDSALPVLLAHGIKPHFVACLERVVATQRLFQGIDELKNTWLVALPFVYSKTLQDYPGPKLLMGTHGLPTKWILEDLRLHSAGPSASTMALTGLDLMGCEPLFLTGQDLSYHPKTGVSHAEGALDYLMKAGSKQKHEMESSDEQCVEVLANSGKRVKTYKPYHVIGQALEELSHRIEKTCYNVIDAKFGIHIDGTERIDPELLKELETGRPMHAAYIRDAIERGNPPWHHEDLYEVLSQLKTDLAGLREHLYEGVERCSRFYHEHLPSVITVELAESYQDEVEALEALANSMLSEHSVMLKFLWPYIMLQHVRTLMKAEELKNGEDSFEATHLPLFKHWETWFRDSFFWASKTEYAIGKALKKGHETA